MAVIALGCLDVPMAYSSDLLTCEQFRQCRLTQRRLGGSSEGGFEITLPGGMHAVYTTRHVSEIDQDMAMIQQLAANGTFVTVLGTARLPEAPDEVAIIMESMKHSPTGSPVMAAGDLRHLHVLRGLPIQQRREIAEQLLKKLILHPDPHSMNIMWRAVRNENGTQVDVRLIDPFDKVPTSLEQAERFGLMDGLFRQRNPDLQSKQIRYALALPDAPHPEAMLNIGRGYGMAAETSVTGRPPVRDLYLSPCPEPTSGFRPKWKRRGGMAGLAVPLALWLGSEAAGDDLELIDSLSTITGGPNKFERRIEEGMDMLPPGTLTPGTQQLIRFSHRNRL